jgi:hypothetical protein
VKLTAEAMLALFSGPETRRIDGLRSLPES